MNELKDSLILIVDDSPTNLKVLGNLLKEEGYRVGISANGKQALEFVHKTLPDLILMDMMMPEMDGIQTTLELKKSPETKDIPIIFVTAASEIKNKVNAFEAGGVDYVTKPYMKEEVLARITVHLQLRNAIEQLHKITITDELTGTFNRRYAYDLLSRKIKDSSKSGEPFVICYIDIDNLKIINDTYGHEKGDFLITTVVNKLKSAIRPTDFLFRMGGDEFIILFADADINDVQHMIISLNVELNKKKIQNIPIDFSYGFTEFVSGNESMTVDELITEADGRMYEDKKKKKKKKK